MKRTAFALCFALGACASSAPPAPAPCVPPVEVADSYDFCAANGCADEGVLAAFMGVGSLEAQQLARWCFEHACFSEAR